MSFAGCRIRSGWDVRGFGLYLRRFVSTLVLTVKERSRVLAGEIGRGAGRDGVM